MERILFYIGNATIEIICMSRPGHAQRSGPGRRIQEVINTLHTRPPGTSLQVDIPELSGPGASRLLAAALAAAGKTDGPRRITLAARTLATFDVLSAQAERHFAAMVRKTFRNPVPTVDVIIGMPAGIVLIHRKNPPPGWALPGGFVEYGESLEEAAVRECSEETGLVLSHLRQFHTYSRPDRDPRLHTISTVFTARARGTPHAADDARAIRIFPPDKLPRRLAFDHAAILADYFSREGRRRVHSNISTSKVKES